MNTIEAIRSRRAIKHFDPTHKMPEDIRQTILSTAILAPTAFNIQHWRLLVVDDPELRKQIRAVSWDQSQVTDSSLFIIVCGDIKAWEKNPHRYWQNAPEAVRDFIVPAIHQYYQGREQVQRDEVMRSAGIISQTLMITAKELGYDSCPMDGFDFDAVGKLINLPSDYAIAMFVAIGLGVKEAWPRAGQLPLGEVVTTNRF